MILQERVHDIFDMPGNIEYAPTCSLLHVVSVELYHVHADGTSRVQTVNKQDPSDLHRLLTEFEKRTGCPYVVEHQFKY